jgi:hypothetical protein
LKFAFGLWKRHADREFSMVKKTPHQNIESKKTHHQNLEFGPNPRSNKTSSLKRGG